MWDKYSFIAELKNAGISENVVLMIVPMRCLNLLRMQRDLIRVLQLNVVNKFCISPVQK